MSESFGHIGKLNLVGFLRQDLCMLMRKDPSLSLVDTGGRLVTSEQTIVDYPSCDGWAQGSFPRLLFFQVCTVGMEDKRGIAK